MDRDDSFPPYTSWTVRLGQRKRSYCGVAWCWLAALGCSNQPAPIVAPAINAGAAAAHALEQCDKNGDAALSVEELKVGCPGILLSLAKYDTDGNQQVTANEIEARIGRWTAGGAGITTNTFFVLLDGRPLANARVELTPEPFFDDMLFPAESGVSEAGMCTPSMAKENMPDGVPVGIYFGLYRVKITHPDKAIPGRYNEQSELGIEICPDYDVYNPVKFKLTSK